MNGEKIKRPLYARVNCFTAFLYSGFMLTSKRLNVVFSDRSHWTFTASTVILILIRKYTNINLFIFRRAIGKILILYLIKKINSRNMMTWTVVSWSKKINLFSIFVRSYTFYIQSTHNNHLSLFKHHLTTFNFIRIYINCDSRFTIE